MGCLTSARALVLNALLEVEAKSEIMAGRVVSSERKDRDNVEQAVKRRTADGSEIISLTLRHKTTFSVYDMPGCLRKLIDEIHKT